MIRSSLIGSAVILATVLYPSRMAAQTSLPDQAAAAETAGDYRRAIDLLGQAIRATPGDASLHIARGAAFFHENYFADSIREFRTALALRPGDLTALSNLALGSMQIGDLQSGISALEQVIADQAGDQQLRETLAQCYLKTGKWQNAAQQYELLLESDPASPVFLYSLGVERKHLDDPTAQPLFRRALQLQADFPAAQLELAELLWNEGRLEEAEIDLRELVQAHRDFLAAYFPLTEVLRQMNRTEEALSATQTILRADPGNASAYQELAMLEKQLGHKDAAAAAFHHAEERRNQAKLRQAAQTATKSGIRLLLQEKRGEAVQKLRFAVQLDPGNADAHYWLGLAMEKQPAEAAAEFRKAYAGDARLKPPFNNSLDPGQP